MAAALVDRVWSDLSDRVGDDLRAVTRYQGGRFETRMRGDVRERYDRTEDQRIVDETVVDQLRGSDVSERFRAGDLRALVRFFEEAWVVSWPDGPKSGVVVSIGRGGEATVDDVEWSIDYLEENVAPTTD
ncbi:MAG: hypothetical protein ABEH47_02620 [Haloferacaceae archaeon]